MAYFHTTVLDNQIKALPTVDTASGAIATFNTDLTENLVSVKCQIVAKQASGTPSPVNPLPIQTYDSLTLYHNDINMWDEQMQGGSINTNTGVITINPSSTTKVNLHKLYTKPNTQYNMHKENNVQFFICFYNANDEVIQYVVETGDTGSAYNKSCLCAANVQNTVFTTPTGTAYIYFRMDFAGATPTNISVNYPSTNTQYHAFNGAYIPFGQTVANGVLDITTGKLTITHGIKDLGTINYTFSADDSVKQDFNSAGIQTEIKGVASTVVANMICEQLRTTSRDIQANNPTSVYYSIAVQPSGVLRIITPPNTYATTTDLKTALSNCLLVFEYITPKEIQLDSITLQALLNENNIWCDTGDTEVKFLLTVGKKIS